MKLSAISLVLWWWAAAASASAPEAVAVVHQLRPAVGWGAQLVREKGEGVITCGSWRVGVEANNVRGWRTIPAACEGYVGHYMLGDRYRQDSIVVAIEAAAHAAALRLAGNGSDVWVFDVDETALSNLPYYARHGFGIRTWVSGTNHQALLPLALGTGRALQSHIVQCVGERGSCACATGEPESLQEAALPRHQDRLPHRSDREPEGRHCTKLKASRIPHLGKTRAQRRRRQEIGRVVQIRREAEAGK
ncbi:vegetative storage protein 2-like isoform X3 [Ananas comosus]|uniref:Vegetative storage protein 2-like isoform X3 n=1 Tax=Ananas comosus TaxID=4615 RepID=A0A6P5FWF3_ANACO|nr:vegetative storage protein 2-like isoform X3 [Ananas comosus]